MKNAILTIIILFLTNIAVGQNYKGYSNDSLIIKSKYLKETISLNLHIPETFNYSANSTKYPVTIVFDSQHERTYPQIFNAISLLTNESQMPETIIVGIPFSRNNRYYLTSNKKAKNDSLSGIERMEKFIFDELIPKLKKEHKTNDFITLIGHSRTAFLVNYLSVKQSQNIDIAIALSGFYNNEPLTVENFKSQIANDANFPNKFRYYFTAGTTLEEETYLTQCKDVSDFISNNEMPKNFEGYFTETKNANHMTNYWVSVPVILMDAFTDYNFILNNWFHKKIKRDTILNPIAEFETDLEQTSKKLGFEINPSLTHIFSLASTFGYEKKDYNTAINFLKLGKKYYPGFPFFDLELIGYYKSLNDQKMVDYYKAEYRANILSKKDISEIERTELLKAIEN